MPLTTHRPHTRITWVRDDAVHDQARYRIEVFGREARLFDVVISLTAKAQATPSPEEKIGEWFKHNLLPEGGVIVKLPDYHFFPQLH
jgi:hypothetical protein